MPLYRLFEKHESVLPLYIATEELPTIARVFRNCIVAGYNKIPKSAFICVPQQRTAETKICEEEEMQGKLVIPLEIKETYSHKSHDTREILCRVLRENRKATVYLLFGYPAIYVEKPLIVVINYQEFYLCAHCVHGVYNLGGDSSNCDSIQCWKNILKIRGELT